MQEFSFIKAAGRKYKTSHSLSLCSWDQLLAIVSPGKKKKEKSTDSSEW